MADALPAQSPSHTARPPHVRVATPADAAAVYDLLVAAHADNGVLSFDEQRVRHMVHLLTDHPEGSPLGMIGIIDAPDGILAGAVIIMLTQWWFTSQWVLDELVNFVRVEHRKSTYASDLMDFAKWSADSFGVPLSMAVVSTKRTDAKIRLYGRKMRQVGGMFMHGIERGGGPLAMRAATDER